MKEQTMKRTILAAAFIAILGSAGVSWGADIQKGIAAFKRGGPATALREWFQLAAEEGYASAQYYLGQMYRNGRGVPQDDKAAMKWYTLAAKQGYADAQYNLGVMYEKGRGVSQDDKTAVKWYKLAAERGDADAQYNLGVMYAFGKGVPKDYVYTHMWGNLAASNGMKKGAELREQAAKEMAPSQLEKAQDLARECLRKKYKGC
jgi:TPR repeat protein